MVAEKTPAVPSAMAPTPPASARTPTLLKGHAVRPRPIAPAQSSAGATQLLRKIAVAGVTVEVVRQDSTIIYRLPDNMPVSSLTPEQRTKVMDEIQRMRRTTAAPNATRPNSAAAAAAAKQLVRPQQPGSTSAGRNGVVLPTPTSAGGISQRQSQLQPRPAPPRVGRQESTTVVQSRSSQVPPPIRVSRSAVNLGVAASGTARLHTALPNIAPRTATPASSAPGSGQASPRSVSVSTSASLLPTTPQTPAARPHPRIQIRPGNASIQPRQAQSLFTSPAILAPATPTSQTAQTQKSALEKMYQSAYLKLLSGPAEVLKRLEPPIELSDIANINTDDVVSPASLLLILKALTKKQASQLAWMHDRDQKRSKPLQDINTAGLRQSPMGSVSSSREVSPSADSVSGTEQDSTNDLLNAAEPLPVRKRKYNKTGKYSVKKRLKEAGALSGPPSPSSQRPPSLQRMSSSTYTHTDLIRKGARPLAERRRFPDQVKHEAEISKRFREALSMDHQMVGNPDWRTPFTGTKDAIQRLLPYHVFQYPDSAIESGISQQEKSIEASSETLGKRLGILAQRYNRLLVNEGSDGFYSVDGMQLEYLLCDDLKQQRTQLEDIQLQRDISSLGPVLNPTKNSTPF
ncbi:hypothetical protein GGF39_001346 [Coemansia sp. RSA 1721]|nr:hypothetical protein GGF39_001346 [Coemansia sp. RSA 1721]